MAEMTKEEAIEYLERKGRIEGTVKYSKAEQKEITEVVKRGRIFGDPVCILD